jgi:hypothetical protein
VKAEVVIHVRVSQGESSRLSKSEGLSGVQDRHGRLFRGGFSEQMTANDPFLTPANVCYAGLESESDA